jgi:hypothetical protein
MPVAITGRAIATAVPAVSILELASAGQSKKPPSKQQMILDDTPATPFARGWANLGNASCIGNYAIYLILRILMEAIDIWCSTNQLIKSYGDKAAERAAAKVVEMQRAEDMDGMTVWLQIMLAIRELQKDKPSDGEPVN